ncbi:MAG: ABC-2 family transporter protein [Peptostreptococcaceae bacterium]|nr:ABC-2 family transporter protein [Peptostreptococcaceae bacterium]
MSGFFRSMKIFVIFIKYNLKSKIAFYKDMKIGLFVVLTTTALQISSLGILFRNFNRIGDWSYRDMLLLFSIYSININVFQFFFGNFRNLKKYIFNGELEMFLTKPVDSILMIRCRELNVESVIGAIIGLLIFIYCCMSIEISFWTLLNALLFSFSGITLLYSLVLVCQSFLFYTGYRYTPYDSLMELVGFSRYPVSIFGTLGRILLGTVIPIAFLGATPASVLLSKDEFIFDIMPFFSVLVIFILSKVLFYKSLRRYDGLGN